jgi:hypothetical protein
LTVSTCRPLVFKMAMGSKERTSTGGGPLQFSVVKKVLA